MLKKLYKELIQIFDDSNFDYSVDIGGKIIGINFDYL